MARVFRFAKKICPKCNGEGRIVKSNGEVVPCDYPGCGGDGWIET